MFDIYQRNYMDKALLEIEKLTELLNNMFKKKKSNDSDDEKYIKRLDAFIDEWRIIQNYKDDISANKNRDEANKKELYDMVKKTNKIFNSLANNLIPLIINAHIENKVSSQLIKITKYTINDLTKFAKSSIDHYDVIVKSIEQLEKNAKSAESIIVKFENEFLQKKITQKESPEDKKVRDIQESLMLILDEEDFGVIGRISNRFYKLYNNKTIYPKLPKSFNNTFLDALSNIDKPIINAINHAINTIISKKEIIVNNANEITDSIKELPNVDNNVNSIINFYMCEPFKNIMNNTLTISRTYIIVYKAFIPILKLYEKANHKNR